MEDDQEVPQIKLGDASVAAPFTSKLANVAAITHIIRQGRCTLVATIQMYKILALNCLISAWALSVQYLQGIKFGDYQVTITGVLMSVCFMCISRARPVDRLSKERPLSSIFNLYVVGSILVQFAIHVAAFIYLTNLCEVYEPYVFDVSPLCLTMWSMALTWFVCCCRATHRQAGLEVDLDAKFSPNLLNSCIYLISLSRAFSLPSLCDSPTHALIPHSPPSQSKSRPSSSTSKAAPSARTSRRTRRCTTACSASPPSPSAARPTLCPSSTGGSSSSTWTCRSARGCASSWRSTLPARGSSTLSSRPSLPTTSPRPSSSVGPSAGRRGGRRRSERRNWSTRSRRTSEAH